MAIYGNVKSAESLILSPNDDKVKDTKFLQQRPKRLRNDIIDFFISAKKYPIASIKVKDTELDLDLDFGTIDKEMDTNPLDYCSNGFKFFAVKENNRLYLLGLYTLVTPKGVSCSLYFMPRASYKNMSLLARVCYHKGVNEHTNKLNNKETIGNYVLHMHKMSEEFFDYCLNHYGKDHPELVKKLQSPDAIILSNVDKNINKKQIADMATKMFNLSDKPIYVNVDSEDKIIESILDDIETLQGGM